MQHVFARFVQLQFPDVGIRGMNTTLSLTGKLLLIAVLALVIFHFWPGIAGIAFVGVSTVLGAAGALVATAASVIAGAVAFALAAVVGLAVLGVALLPVLLPLLAIVGLFAVIRSLTTRRA